MNQRSPLTVYIHCSCLSVNNSMACLYFVSHIHTHPVSLLRSDCIPSNTFRLSWLNLSPVKVDHRSAYFFSVCLCVCVSFTKALKVLANIWLWCNTGLPEQTSLGTRCWGFNWRKLLLCEALESFPPHFLCHKEQLTLKHHLHSSGTTQAYNLLTYFYLQSSCS